MTRREILVRSTQLMTAPALTGFLTAAISGRGSSIAGREAALDLIKPPVLRTGDAVAVIAPSTQVTDPSLLDEAERTARYFGLKVKWGNHVKGHRAQGIAAVDERVEDLHGAFRDSDIRAVMCIRGGYGAGQILGSLDYGLIRSNPKILVGYSDITALHLAIHKLAGLVTFHGPVLLSQFTPYTLDCYKRALFTKAPMGELTNPVEENLLRPSHELRTIHEGRATGRLIGGNLSLIEELMGTPYEIETKGRIFFTEDVGEEPYRIDRMLTNLLLAGKLKEVAGLIWGECSDCRPNDFKPSNAWNLTLGEVIDDRFATVTAPTLSGLLIGHLRDQLTLPLGVMATLDATRGKLTIEEAATV